MPSFDIVSEVNMQEVDNAINSVLREIGNRYDFKNVKYSLEFDKNKKEITIVGESDYVLEQLQASLKTFVTRRGMDARILDFSQKPEKASGSTQRQVIKIKEGVSQDVGKQIVKAIKDKKLKDIQASIQGDKVRVTGKKRDNLQEVIAMCKGMDLNLPLQYINFRD